LDLTKEGEWPAGAVLGNSGNSGKHKCSASKCCKIRQKKEESQRNQFRQLKESKVLRSKIIKSYIGPDKEKPEVGDVKSDN
jgi:hypothetical protein